MKMLEADLKMKIKKLLNEGLGEKRGRIQGVS